MKKILSLVLAGLLTASLAATVGAADKLGTIPYVAEEIVVDGAKDAAYEGGMATEVAKVFSNASDSTATVWSIHDGENLYLYAEIKDADMVQPDAAAQESQPWTVDSLEFLVDGTVSGDAAQVFQGRLDWADWACYYTQGGIADYGDAADHAVVEHATVEIDGGYTVEVALNLKKFGASAGSDIGLQFQINDVFSDGTAQSNITINGMGPWDAANYPVATLAPVTGFVAKYTFTDADVIDNPDTNGEGGSGNPIQLMEAYGCGYSSRGDIVVFEDVDFGENGADFLTARFGYGNNDGSFSEIEIMIDDPDSDPIAKMNIGWTGAWEIAPSGYYSLPVDIEGGIHSVYFEFVGAASGSLSEIYFAEAEPAPVEVVDTAAGGTAPATFDAGVIAAVAAIISAAGYAISKKH